VVDIVNKDIAISDAKKEMFASLSFYINQIIFTNNDTKNSLINVSKAVDSINSELVSLDLEDLSEVEKRKAAERRIDRYKEREYIMEARPSVAMTEPYSAVIDSQTQKRGAIDFAKIAGLVGLLLIPQVREAILAVLDGIIRSVVGGEDAIKKFKIAAGLIAGTLALFWSRAKIANIFNALYQVVNLALVTATALGLIQDTADELDNERRRLKKDREAFEKDKGKKTSKGKVVAGAAGAAAGKAVGDVVQESASIPPTEKDIEVDVPDRDEKKKDKEKQPEQKKEESKSKLKKAAGAAGSTAKKLLRTVPIIGAVAGAAEVAYDTAGAIREAEETGKPVDVPEIVTDQIIQNVTFGIFNLESAREKIRKLKGEPAPTPQPAPASTSSAGGLAPAASTPPAPAPTQPTPSPVSQAEPTPVQITVASAPQQVAPNVVIDNRPNVSTLAPEADEVAAQTVKEAIDRTGANDVRPVRSETEDNKAQREVEFASKMFALEIEKGLSVMPEIRSVDSGSQILRASGERAILKETYDVLSRLNIVNINNTKNIFAPEEEMSN
jgi:hypothetical protein